jgi:hypothetical protein
MAELTSPAGIAAMNPPEHRAAAADALADAHGLARAGNYAAAAAFAQISAAHAGMASAIEATRTREARGGR